MAIFKIHLGNKGCNLEAARQHNVIGVGWLADTDLSGFTKNQLRDFNDKFRPLIRQRHPGKTKISAGLNSGNLWVLASKIQVGDLVLTPDMQGGYFWATVESEYMYRPDLAGVEHCRQVSWKGSIDKEALSQGLQNSLGSVMTVMTVKEEYWPEIMNQIEPGSKIISTDDEVEEPYEFALEVHLEDFLIQNWDATKLAEKYKPVTEDGELVGRQYPTDAGVIDILCESHDGKELLVVELKKGRVSDKVVGQTLRYMGFVDQQLADGKKVKGLIIGGSDDKNLQYSLRMSPDITYMKYQLDFRLID